MNFYSQCRPSLLKIIASSCSSKHKIARLVLQSPSRIPNYSCSRTSGIIQSKVVVLHEGPVAGGGDTLSPLVPKRPSTYPDGCLSMAYNEYLKCVTSRVLSDPHPDRSKSYDESTLLNYQGREFYFHKCVFKIELPLPTCHTSTLKFKTGNYVKYFLSKF